MFLGSRISISQVLITFIIGITSYIGDKLLQQKSEVIRALSDNFTHAVIGGLSWTLILILLKKSILQNISSVIICFCISSFIDFDHFIVSGKWSLHDITHLHKRGYLHCSTVPIVITFILLLFTKIFSQQNVSEYAWIILCGFLSHHIRDATRRGLWFCPFGSTPPIPYYLYLTLSMSFPYIIYSLITLFDRELYQISNTWKISVV